MNRRSLKRVLVNCCPLWILLGLVYLVAFADFKQIWPNPTENEKAQSNPTVNKKAQPDQAVNKKAHSNQIVIKKAQLNQTRRKNVRPDEVVLETKLCMGVNPSFETDEFVNGSSVNTGPYCEGRGIQGVRWDVNLNIERSFRFGWMVGNGPLSPAHDGVVPPGGVAMRAPGTSHKSAQKRDSLSDNTNSIPKRLHFLWSDAIIPDAFVGNLKRFREMHPKWEINFWSLKSGRKVVEKYEPDLLETYTKYGGDTLRADALRYVIMYHFGGVYLDLDTTPKRPLDGLTGLDDCIVGAEPIEHAVFKLKMRSFLSNAGFMCRPKHAFFRRVLDTLPSTRRAGYVLIQTGPVFFTRVFHDYINQILNRNQSPTGSQYLNITVARHEYFEFSLTKDSVDVVRRKCKPMTSRVEYYVTHCEGKVLSPLPSNCSELRQKLPPNERDALDACVEWTMHGRDDRRLDASQYIEHIHYGVRFKPKTLTYQKANNISSILPDAVLHL